MARYSLTFAGITPVAVADTTNYTDAGYCTFLQGGSSTMRLNISEVSISGEAPSASTVNRMVFARDSTVAATGISGNRNALIDGSSVAPGTIAVFGTTSTTKPQRSATLHLMNLSMNAFGGIIRLVVASRILTHVSKWISGESAARWKSAALAGVVRAASSMTLD